MGLKLGVITRGLVTHDVGFCKVVEHQFLVEEISKMAAEAKETEGGDKLVADQHHSDFLVLIANICKYQMKKNY